MIGGFRSDLSTTRKTDGNFGNVSAGVLFSKVAYSGGIVNDLEDSVPEKVSTTLLIGESKIKNTQVQS